jgi:hypothetical protein
MTDYFIIGAILLAAMTYAYGYWTGKCSADNPCAKCSFHVNEQRMAKYEAESRRKQRFMDQFELRHEAEHKGFGFRDEDPDRYECANASCERNKRKGTLDS